MLLAHSVDNIEQILLLNLPRLGILLLPQLLERLLPHLFLLGQLSRAFRFLIAGCRCMGLMGLLGLSVGDG